jgi:hypothetical protein
MGSHKHGVSGRPLQSPRLRLMKKLAAERGEFEDGAKRSPKRLQFETVQEALKAARKRR